MIILLEKYPRANHMEPLHKILIAIGIGAIPVGFDRWQTLYDSILGTIHPNLPDGIIISLIIIGALGSVLALQKKRKTEDSHTIQKVVTETLADKHKEIDAYTNHLKKDIFEVLKSKNISFFDALGKEQEKKKMILQHMYTYEEIAGHPFYRNYQRVWIVNNKKRDAHFDLGSIHGKFILDTTDICRNIRDFSSNGTVDHSVLLTTLGFQTNIDMFDDSFDLDKVHSIPEENISKHHFYVERDDKNRTKYYVKYHTTIIATCNSKKIANKLLKSILKHSLDIINYATKLKIEDADAEMYKKAFEKMFSELDETLKHGKPNFGVCDACVNFFPYPNKGRYRYSLLSGDTPINWGSEEIW